MPKKLEILPKLEEVHLCVAEKLNGVLLVTKEAHYYQGLDVSFSTTQRVDLSITFCPNSITHEHLANANGRSS
jgi:hypothetical protein